MDGCVCVTDFRDRTKTSIMKVLIFVECGRFEKHEHCYEASATEPLEVHSVFDI